MRLWLRPLSCGHRGFEVLILALIVVMIVGLLMFEVKFMDLIVVASLIVIVLVFAINMLIVIVIVVNISTLQ